MSQDQLMHISSASIFLGFWVYVLGLFFYVAHAIAPERSFAVAAAAYGGQLGTGATIGGFGYPHGGVMAAGDHESIFSRYRLGLTASGLAYIGFALMTAGLGCRWAAQGYWPVTNAFEAPVAFSWMIVAVYLIAERLMHTRIVGWATMLFVVGLSGYALFNFGGSSTVIDPLRPALQSNWLRIHVGVAMLSYAVFALGGALGLTYMVRTGAWRSPRTFYYALWPFSLTIGLLIGIYIGRWPHTGDAFSVGKAAGIGVEAIALVGVTLLGRQVLRARLAVARPLAIPTEGPEADLLEQLDEWSYRAIAVGVPMIAFVLMSGAIWAQLAWSTFWSWDPKEVWALITFAYYTVYVHVRVQRGWRGAPMAALAVIGFALVIVSFLGLAYIVGTMKIFSLHTFGNVQ